MSMEGGRNFTRSSISASRELTLPPRSGGMISKLMSGRLDCARWSMTFMDRNGWGRAATLWCSVPRVALEGQASVHAPTPAGRQAATTGPQLGYSAPMPVRSWRRESRWKQGLRALGDAAAALAAFAAALAPSAGVLWMPPQLPLPFPSGLLPDDRLTFLRRDWAAVLLAQFATL